MFHGKKPTRKWWAGYQSLYGAQQTELSLPVSSPSKKISSKARLPTEQDEQFVAVAWLRKKGIPVHHSPNGGYRDVREGAKFKRLGTSAGFPDLFIPRMRKGRGGLYIELKRVSGGVLSPGQIYWRDLLISEGYAWYLARGADEVIKIVSEYLA